MKQHLIQCLPRVPCLHIQIIKLTNFPKTFENRFARKQRRRRE